MNTRINVYVLLDHHEYYGTDLEPTDVIELIKDIPTDTLINQISWMNIRLYLNENAENSGVIQAEIVGSIYRHMAPDHQQKWLEVLHEQKKKGHNPVLVWNYSNLLLYDFIFRSVNEKSKTTLNADDAKNVFDALLSVNSFANKKIGKNVVELQNAIGNDDEFNAHLITNFIYQKDYESSTDFNNQVLRGKMFFEYLEGHPKYQTYLLGFYNEKHVSSYKGMFKTLMAIFVQIGIGTDKRHHLISLQQAAEEHQVNLQYVDTLVINAQNVNYVTDESFGMLRNRFLYKIDQYRFIVLDVNFLLDQFYKAQIFAFNSFLKRSGDKGDFLSTKAKSFLEDIYFRHLILGCFPFYRTFFGDECVNSKTEELCDAYLREGNKICIVELKDTLLNASIKNSGDRVKLIAELNKKFVTNQNNKKKGISQLLDAIIDIDAKSVSFDNIERTNRIDIYPVVAYTDNAFGAPGINKMFGKSFQEGLSNAAIANLTVYPLTFINLNFFELRQDYLSNKHIDLFEMLEGYHKHIAHPDFHLTTFEVFGKFYMLENGVPEMDTNSSFRELVTEIIASPDQ